MSAVLDQLIIELKADIKGLQTSLSAASSSVERFSSKADSDVSRLQKAVEGVRRSVITLTAAWAAFRVGKSIVDAGVQMQALNAKMVAATGNALVAADSIKFIRQEAERLGLDFRSTADGFASFAASALRAGLSIEEVRNIFTGVSEAATGMRLSAERTSLVFIALSQMASKGTVSMEELKQQLGESLPGALQVFAKAMGVSNDQFIKMIGNGQVTTRDLIKLGEGLRKDFGGAAQEAAQGAQAAFYRLGNTWFNLQVKMANSGFLGAIVDAVRGITNTLNDPKLQDGLAQFAKFMGILIELAVKAAAKFGEWMVVLGEFEHKALAMVGIGEEVQKSVSKPVKVAVSPTVDPNYTLGKTSSPVSTANKKAESIRNKVNDMTSGLITEMDTNKTDSAKAMAELQKKYLEEQRLLEDALAKKAITEKQFREDMLAVDMDYEARKAEIHKRYREDFLSDEQAFAEGFLGIQLEMQERSMVDQGRMFADSISQAAQHNRLFFALEKARALATAILSARESVVTAYAWGSRFGGPVGGAAAAAVAAAAQAVNIAAIAGASFGGGSSNVSSGGGGNFSSSDASSAGATSSVSPNKTVFIELKGDNATFYSRNNMRDLISAINDALADGSRLNVVSVS